MSTPRFAARVLTLATGFVALGVLATAAPTGAQTLGDRQLLATQGGKPYVMILFDTSGSMNWATQCTADDVAIGRCNHLCSAPNCPQPMNGDDPESKVFQAKKALYEVMLETEGVRWGFASLNQDELTVSAKHWLYQVTDIDPADDALDGLPHFPALGWQEVFGPKSGGNGAAAFDLGCDRKNPGSDDNNAALYETGCYMTSQDAPVSNTTDTWTLNKLRRLPKGGLDGTSSTSYFLTKSGTGSQPYYRVTYSDIDGSVAGTPYSYAALDTLTLTVNIDSCPSNKVSAASTGCTDPWTAVSTRTITYSKVGQFLFWEGTPTNDANLQKNAQFGGRTDGTPIALSGVDWANDTYADKTCRGWEPSGTSYPGQSNLLTDYVDDTDPYSGYNLRWPDTGLVFDPDEPVPADGTSFDWIFQNGDIIPLNWVEDADNDEVNDNKLAILKRLNPLHPIVDDNLSFAEAPFFADDYEAGESFLRLKNEEQRPLVSMGSTPLAGWFSMFRKWYSGCGKPGNCTEEDGSGWQDIAAKQDPTFNCSKKYVLMITDGAETCDGSPQENAEDYYQDNPTEFPDGFSKTADQCRYRASLLAQEDVKSLVIGFGTENKAKLQCANTPVFYADTAGELKDLLLKLIGEILEEAATFASAAVPTVQANILDKVYLSSFIPLQGESVWPGRLDAFLKPLPLDNNNLPDHSATCVVGQQSECFAWDGGDSQLAWNTDLTGWVPPDGLLAQAPFPEDILRYDNATLKIGDDAAQRRVFFGRPDDSDLGHRRYFRYPTTDAEWTDLEFVWNITDDVALSETRKAEISDILEFTLEQKRALIDRACTAGVIGLTCAVDADCDVTAGDGIGVCSDNVKVQYVMGDIFHSNPAVINPPSDFELFTKDLYWDTPLCGRTDADLSEQHATRGAQISYSWYSNKNLCRRVMVAVGSDDGQLHVFDGGIIRDITPDDPTTDLIDERVQADCKLNVPANSSSRFADLFDDDGAAGTYDYGTGREIFSFIPQSMMPVVKELSGLDELTTQYGIDGSVRTTDVFIDPAAVGGAPECEQRTWRTLLFANYREGGPGFAALDITQPDIFDSGNQPIPLTNSTPSYVPSCIDGGAGCDEFCAPGDVDCAALPFPALKWEFRDIDANTGLPANDDGIGGDDLAESWSRPLIIRHPVCDGTCDDATEAEDHWLAVFGGGLPEAPTNDASEIAGNWVYMVDVETGKVVYKRGGVAGMVGIQPIEGAVASDVTGVDFDVDGIVDTLYFGTTAGFVYKVDLGDAPWELDANGQLTDPVLEPGKYRPYKVFTTGGRSIYLEINSVYVPKMRANALLFGTGIRWNLWDERNLAGRFYAIIDSDWEDANHDGIIDDPVECNGTCALPIDESSLISIDPDTGPYAANYLYGNIAADKLPGWYFPLPADEKLITEPFTLSGVTFFTIFSPTLSEADDTCALGGESKIFVVNTVTTKGYAVALNDTTRVRYTTAPTFTTQPYVEASATKNKPDSSSTANADTWTSNLAEINSDLRKLFPPGARFANYTLDIKTIRKDTGIVFVAPVPVAIEPHNWKEF